MKVRWWRPGDLDTYAERAENKELENTFDMSVESLARIGHTVVIVNDADRPVMALGVLPLWTGVGQAWASPTDLIRGHALTAVRTAIQCLYAICTRENIHRVASTMPSSLVENIKWIELLGFHREATLKHACPDKSDAYIYVKFFGEIANVKAKNARTRMGQNVVQLFDMEYRHVGTPLP